jgi:hypothetical protein
MARIVDPHTVLLALLDRMGRIETPDHVTGQVGR